MKKNIILFIFLLIGLCLSGKSPIDPNQDYINRQIKKSRKLDDSDFFKGYIIKNKDTINCRIYLKKGKVSKDSYLFVLTKIEKDSLVYYSAKDIDGYVVNGNVFIKHNSTIGGYTSFFFIKFLERGCISLFEKESTPNERDYVFYLKFTGNRIYAIAPFTEDCSNLFRAEATYSGTKNLMDIKSNMIDETFKNGFSILLQDCPEVVNKVKSGFYGLNDVEKIIREYNRIKNGSSP